MPADDGFPMNVPALPVPEEDDRVHALNPNPAVEPFVQIPEA